MDAKQLIANVTEQVEKTANVRAVFGEPVQADGVTLIPVACIKVSGGGGGGFKPANSDDAEGGHRKGVGMGMNIVTAPVGFIEIRDGEAQFVNVVDKNKLAFGAVIAGGLVALMAIKMIAKQLRRS